MRAALRRVRRSRLAPRLSGVVLYLGLALWTMWPIVQAPTTRLALGVDPVATVPLFNVWTIWWNSDRARHGWRDYWDAPIFHPAEDTFAFSEPQPTSAVVAPVIWLTGSRVLAYNVYQWLGLVLNGVFAQHLLRLLGIGRWLAVAGGAAMVLLPIVHWQRDVIQLMPLWGILWTWAAMLKILRRTSTHRIIPPCRSIWTLLVDVAYGRLRAVTSRARRWAGWRGAVRPGLELGAAFTAAFLTCGHHGLFLAALLAGTVLVLHHWCLHPRTWPAWLAAAIVAVLVLGPMVGRMQRALEQHKFTRDEATVTLLSAMPRDYAAAWGRSWIDAGESIARPHWRMSPGWIKVSLALCGILFGLCRRRWRRWTAFLLVTAVLAFLLSLGTNLKIREWQAWDTITQAVPGFAQVRNVFRFGYFVQMAVVILSVQALHALYLLGRRFLPGTGSRYAPAAAVALLGIAIVLEVRPEPVKFETAPDFQANRGWIEFVRQNTPPGRSIACIPFAPGNGVRDFDWTTRWMYCGTYHGVPLVNGYSGFFPASDYQIRGMLQGSGRLEDILRKFGERDVEFLVMIRSQVYPDVIASVQDGPVTLELVHEDRIGDDSIDVYRLRVLR
jgi:hypothetical protein